MTAAQETHCAVPDCDEPADGLYRVPETQEFDPDAGFGGEVPLCASHAEVFGLGRASST